ncbi:MAG TPA: DUF2931 family protein [Dyella sp.]|uniref:DUF2931 family protein n=1 Tax=Dyella sp. TaxID=1869338 RepID=UPI002C3285AB|nr:DUF2931 family protein [Dyella sp.]HTV86375.1 DUF2931 family protein [Dyella sp.]
MLLVALSLSACASEQERSDARTRPMVEKLCDHWSMGVLAPGYMEAWVEDLEVRDDRGRWVQMPQGMAGDMGQTVGWDPKGGVAGQTLYSAGAPMEVYVRWQSLAEAQTYRWHFTISESLRQALVKQEPVVFLGKAGNSCRSNITIGVAPGGRTIVWNSGFGFETAVVMYGQGEVEPLGPWQGKGKEYAYPLSDKAKQYVQEHGIPYGSWDPPPSSTIPVVTAATAQPGLPLPAKVDVRAKPAGTYVLSNVMDVDSTVILRSDGSFDAGIQIGSAYGLAAGHWMQHGDTIRLKRDARMKVRGTVAGSESGELSPMFDDMALTIDDDCLRTGMMGQNACYLRQ